MTPRGTGPEGALRWPDWLSYGLAVALLSWVALYNGYPLVSSDSGTYVDSSFGLKVPLDRPGAYGIVLAASHWKLSLWLPVVLQGALVVFVIDAVVRGVAGIDHARDVLAIVLTLAATSALPWFTGQLMPDVFTGVLVLSLFLLLFCPGSLAGWRRVVLELLCGISIAVHFSHLALGLGLLVATAGWCLWHRSRSALDLRRAAAVLVCAMAASVAFNWVRTGEPFLSGRMSHVFLTGRLVKDGLIQRLLDEHCRARAYALCPYRDRIVADSDHWVWSPDSAVHAIGGFVGSRDESRRMIRDSIVAYPGAQLTAALHAIADQLGHFRTGDGLGAFGDDAWVSTVVKQRFPAEVPAYQASRQQRRLLWDDGQRAATLHVAVILACLVASPLLAVHDARRGRAGLACLHAWVWLALLLNAAITGVLSTISDRYQARVVWLLPLAVLLSLRAMARNGLSPSPRRV